MNHKTLVKIAIVMIFVFGAITVLYPRIFAPDQDDIVVEPTTTDAPVTE